MMERAGSAAAEVARAMLGDRSGPVVVLAGPGNNGGDAFVVARWLRMWFHDVTAVFLGDAEKLPTDAAAAHDAFLHTGGATTRELPSMSAALIVDGLFGIGLRRAPTADYAALIEWANRSEAPTLALDIPSGLDADTGTAFSPAICADATATFLALKPGLLTGDGVDLCGAISIHALGIDIENETTGRKLEWPVLSAALPAALRRDRRNVHKGTFGTLAIVGGAHGMVGAPLLAGRAAMKVGAGKVRIGFIALERPSVDVAALELMLADANAVIDEGDCLLIGPGLGTDAVALGFLERALAVSKPLVVDADALNLIAQHSRLRIALRQRQAPSLATPHPAEAARLLATDTAHVEADRLAAAEKLARELNASVVLKGAGSVLAYPDGSFDVNASGGPALATAGSGDVLAGMLGAFVAQQLDAKTALRYAVCLHGAAADALVARGIGPAGLVASELPDSARLLMAMAASGRHIEPLR
ncbi:MAG TPA: NAD(P)H-hydrate dehydratase [Casimicrobiaceae bacterium]|nr:NAD(P)H-hydrate dehydratase [Casimicrobiaceae bacterium]